MKRHLAVFLAVVMFLTICLGAASVSASGADDSDVLGIIVDGGTERLIAKPGETVSVSVRLLNNPGISSLKAKISWDDRLSLVDAVYDIYDPADRSSMINEPYAEDGGDASWSDADGAFMFNWISARSESKSDKFVTLTFKVDEEAPDYTLLPVTAEVDPEDVFSVKNDDEPIPFDISNGGVYVINRDPIDIMIDDQAEAAAGKLAVVKVRLLHDVEISSLKAVIRWSDKLTLVDAVYDIYDPKDKTAIINEPEYDDDLNPMWETVDGAFTFNWLTGTRQVNGEDVCFLTLTFRVGYEASEGEYLPVTAEINVSDVFVGADREIPFVLYNGGVTVITETPGDIDKDGVICNKDAVALYRFEHGELAEAAGEDVNGDRAVDGEDLAVLFGMVNEFEPVSVEAAERNGFAEVCADKLAIVTDGAEEANEGFVGKTVEVAVRLVNNPGISSLKTVIAWPEELKLLDARYDIFDASDASALINTPADGWNGTDGCFAFNWISAENTAEGDRTFVTLTFLVTDKAEEGQFLPVTVYAEEYNVFAGLNDEVEFEIYNGGVDARTFTAGDVNDDGVINNKDAFVLAKYLNGETVDSFTAFAADFNGDGSIDGSDLEELLTVTCSFEPVAVEATVRDGFAEIPDGTLAVVVDGAEEKFEGFVGKTVDVSVRLINNPGVSSVKATVSFPTGLKLINAVYDIAGDDDIITVPAGGWEDVSAGYGFNWISAGRNVEEDCAFVTLTFLVTDEAVKGQFLPVIVTACEGDIFASSGKDVGFEICNGGVDALTYTVGDVNGDEIINNKDVMFLAKYLKGGSVAGFISFAADVNIDGEINDDDCAALFTLMACAFEAETVEPAERGEYAVIEEGKLGIVADGAEGELEGFVGETVDVSLKLVNNPGINSLKAVVSFPSELKLLNAVYDILNETEGSAFVNTPDDGWGSVSGSFAFNWISPEQTVSGDVTFVTLTFLVTEEAENGQFLPVTVTVDEYNVFEGLDNEIEYAVYNGGVDAVDYMLGDVNGDGVVNNKDVVMLFKYVNIIFSSENIIFKASDLNGDGLINNKDVVLLFKLVSIIQISEIL